MVLFQMTIFNRYSKNPIIKREDIPLSCTDGIESSSVFNPGAILDNGIFHLLLRVQNRQRKTFLTHCSSTNGHDFTVDAQSVRINGVDELGLEIFHIYDPRIVKIEDVFLVSAAVDVEDGCRIAIFSTKDFKEMDLIHMGDIDSRNGVLFPEKINGHYCLLDRPNNQFAGGVMSGSQVCFSASTDLISWGRSVPVMSGNPHYWDELIGAGPPPIRTKEGWLLVYHGVATHFMSSNIYQAGVALLDANEPHKVLARCPANIFEPRESYELIGQVPNVVFPTGLLVDASSENAENCNEVLMYYGAADSSVCLAKTTIQKLLDCLK